MEMGSLKNTLRIIFSSFYFENFKPTEGMQEKPSDYLDLPSCYFVAYTNTLFLRRREPHSHNVG